MKLSLRPSRLVRHISRWSANQSAGFSLVELVSTMACIGVLAAIAAPGWLTFTQQRRLSTAQEQAVLALRTAQHQASLRQVRQRLDFRQTAAGVEWSVYPASHSATNWQLLSSEISIDSSTTLNRNGEVYGLQFDEEGQVSGQLGRLILTIEGTRFQRCIFTSTLLGATRTAEGSACTR